MGQAKKRGTREERIKAAMQTTSNGEEKSMPSFSFTRLPDDPVEKEELLLNLVMSADKSDLLELSNAMGIAPPWVWEEPK